MHLLGHSLIKYCRKSQKTKQYQIGDVILAATPGGGGQLNVKMGYQARPKIPVRRVLSHNPALYVCNVNSVSNSCKIGLKVYDFLEILHI